MEDSMDYEPRYSFIWVILAAIVIWAALFAVAVWLW